MKKELNDLDIKVELDVLSGADHARRMDLKEKMFDMEKLELLDIKQKARVNWVQMGDENSKYFHRSLKLNHRRNFIHGISINGT